MIRAMWTAASGMAAQQLNMDVLAHNLANSNTTGFKGSYATFSDQFSQTMRFGSAPGRMTERNSRRSLAPMASAKVSTTPATNAGSRRKPRSGTQKMQPCR